MVQYFRLRIVNVNNMPECSVEMFSIICAKFLNLEVMHGFHK